MRVLVKQETTKLPGYKKIYLSFGVDGNALSKKIGQALQTKQPKYIGGREPRYSLYLGKQRKLQIADEEQVKKPEATPSGGLLSFYERMAKDDPSYKFDCMCGCKFKNKKLYFKHQAFCSVIKAAKPLLDRCKNSPIVKEMLGGRKTKKKRKEKRPKVQLTATAREQKRAERIKRDKRKLRQRNRRS